MISSGLPRVGQYVEVMIHPDVMTTMKILAYSNNEVWVDFGFKTEVLIIGDWLFSAKMLKKRGGGGWI